MSEVQEPVLGPTEEGEVRRGLVLVAAVLVACSSSGVVSAPKGSPVPGTFASVGHHTASPVYVGEFVGRLKKVGDACSGTSDEGGSGPWSVTTYTDKLCRVFVSAITQGGGNEGPPPGGTRVPATKAP